MSSEARLFVYGMVIPGAIGLAVFAAFVLPGELTWMRLIIGGLVMVAVQATGGYVGGRLAVRPQRA